MTIDWYDELNIQKDVLSAPEIINGRRYVPLSRRYYEMEMPGLRPPKFTFPVEWEILSFTMIITLLSWILLYDPSATIGIFASLSLFYPSIHVTWKHIKDVYRWYEFAAYEVISYRYKRLCDCRWINMSPYEYLDGSEQLDRAMNRPRPPPIVSPASPRLSGKAASVASEIMEATEPDALLEKMDSLHKQFAAAGNRLRKNEWGVPLSDSSDSSSSDSDNDSVLPEDELCAHRAMGVYPSRETLRLRPFHNMPTEFEGSAPFGHIPQIVQRMDVLGCTSSEAALDEMCRRFRDRSKKATDDDLYRLVREAKELLRWQALDESEMAIRPRKLVCWHWQPRPRPLKFIARFLNPIMSFYCLMTGRVMIPLYAPAEEMRLIDRSMLENDHPYWAMLAFARFSQKSIHGTNRQAGLRSHIYSVFMPFVGLQGLWEAADKAAFCALDKDF
jgi:hypothetical protein